MAFRWLLSLTAPLLVLAVCALGCRNASRDATRTDSASSRLGVAVVIEPLAFLVRQIGGDDVEVEVIVPTGRNPESYQPTPRNAARLEDSRLLFRLGFSFEKALLPKLPHAARRTVVDLREGLPLHTAATHSHAHEHSENCVHDDGTTTTTEIGSALCASDDGSDNHVWLSPTLLQRIVGVIAERLSSQYPAAAERFAVRAAALTDRLAALRHEIGSELAPFRGETLLVVHPAYRYFCDDFGLAQRAIEFEGRSLRPREVAAWIKDARGRAAVPVIIVQPEFSRTSAQAIAEATGGTLVEHAPLEGDLFLSLRRLTAAIARAR